MPSIKCSNPECLNFHNEIYLARLSMRLADGELVPLKPIKCEWCGAEMKIQKDIFDGIPAYGRFKGMCDEDKKRVLAKRAKDHYNKEGKQQKRANFQKFMRNL